MKRSILVWLLGLAVAFGLAQAQDGAGQPTAPDTTQEQQAPDTDQPAAPDTEQPAAPDTEEPAAPDTETPGTEEPAQPGDEGMPGEAQDEDTETPGQEEPTGPTEPATPAQPADPGEPTQPGTPTEPGTPEAPTDEAAAGDAAAGQELIDALRANPDFSTFVDALDRAGLSETLANEGPFTILAPTNQAFEAAGISLDSLGQEELTSLVRNHIISGVVGMDQLATLAGVVTLLGTEYAVAPSGNQQVAGAPQDEGVAGGGAADPATPAEPSEPAEPATPTEPEGEEPAAPAGQGEAGMGVTVGGAQVVHRGVETASGVVYGIDSLLVPAGLVGGGGAGEPAQDEGTEEPATDPAAPGTEDPATDPAAPGTEDPATDPAAPGTEDPFTDPAAPGAEDPATDPAEPGTEDPVTAPAEPGTEGDGTTDPAAPGTDDPAAPGDAGDEEDTTGEGL